MKDRILVTGSQGMLARALIPCLTSEYEVVGVDIDEADVSQFEKIKKVVLEAEPKVVIHLAAFTAVDECETQPEKAFLVNAIGTQNVALVCGKLDIPIVYLSTDYVFDGQKSEPYIEFDPPHPLNIYGQSKLAGENYVTQLLSKYYIIRTSWLYGEGGKNFVDTIINYAQQGKELRVVSDQVGTPTYTYDLALEIVKLIKSERFGVYHVSNNGTVSWYEFACEILRLAQIPREVTPISSEELTRAAKRPPYSVLRNYCLELLGQDTIRNWREALKTYIKRQKSKKTRS
jgi:dTDP-4-dehydrorhamnose reductase